MHDVIDAVAAIVGPVHLDRRSTVAGDVTRTAGDHTRITRATGWRPQVALREGLERHIAWARRTGRGPNGPSPP
jgi:nucleoside-diphosphate-sugar epimerase